MTNLFTLSFWFASGAIPLSAPFKWLLLAMTGVFLVITIILGVIKSKKSPYRGLLISLYSFCLTNSIIGLLLSFFHWQEVVFFTARYWLLLWVLAMLLWLIFILTKIKQIPKAREELQQEKQFNKYIPTKKK